MGYEGDVLGFDEGVVENKQTEFARWVVKIGEWECTCGDYYCNEEGKACERSGKS